MWLIATVGFVADMLEQERWRNFGMRLWILVVLVGVITQLMCSCASIVSKSSYPVSITSEPSGADITIVDESGRTIVSDKTPTTVTLEAGGGYFKGKDYTVTFTKPGYAKHTAEIRRSVDGWYVIGNVVFGGLIGWLIVDPITGAMWTLPNEVTATLSPQTSLLDSDASMRIVSVDQVSEHLRSEMVRVR